MIVQGLWDETNRLLGEQTRSGGGEMEGRERDNCVGGLNNEVSLTGTRLLN